VPVASHAVWYAQIVRDKAALRSLIHASTEILRDAYDPSQEPRELIGRAEERIFAIHDGRDEGEVAGIGEVLLQAFDQLNARLDHQAGAGGVQTGLTDLDHLTGGMHDSELIILAARPSMGKTALAANIAENAALKEGVTTLFVSLEMSRLELGLRMLCSHGRVNSHRVRNGFISALDKNKLVDSMNALSQSKLFIDDSPSRTMTEIAATARRLKRKSNLGLIVIDYLQLIEPDNSREDADVVMFVHRESYYQTNEEERAALAHEAEIIISKQRNGPVGDIKLVWQGDYTRFENLDHRHGDGAEAF